MGDLWARSPDGRHTCLYVLVVRYIYDSSVQALDSPGAADDARRQGAGLSLNTQLVVNLLSKGLWVVARWSREMRAPKNGFFPSRLPIFCAPPGRPCSQTPR